MKRTPLNKVSKARAALNVKRRAFVRDILEERPECEAHIPLVCSHYAVDVHELSLIHI